MRLLGVIDLRDGQAVHARRGRRHEYAPVASRIAPDLTPGNALGLARGYRDRLGLRELYVADLDAIIGPSADADQRTSPFQESPVRALAALGLSVAVDAGVSTREGARRVLASGASQVVVGLETLDSFGALESICRDVGPEQVAFSLDLRAGRPIVAPGQTDLADEPAERIAARACASGIMTIILIDLARVGAGSGLDEAQIARVRRAAPDVTLLAGGGIRGVSDLRALARLGCDGALVASALHDGRIGPDEVVEVLSDRR